MHSSPDRTQRLGLRLASIGSIALVVLCALSCARGAGARGFAMACKTRWDLSSATTLTRNARTASDRGHDTTAAGNGPTLERESRSTPAASITRRWRMARRAFSASSSGPARASRAMAIVHIAVFDAVNAISGHYRSYTGIPAAARNTSMEAAIAQAAHDTLSALFPSQQGGLRRAARARSRTRSTTGASKRGGILSWATRRRRDPEPARERRFGARRTPCRYRILHQLRAGQMAPGPGEQDTDRARRLLV